ncbi:YbjQ family protein [Polaribacter sp. WD7]|uniref:YbjQ family protein n=1 Tax=Polaribacter sp. WD7 TaxID=2269061 RepID=UPI001C69FE27|nr:YbjQ family protein [Polaribacter sp. WD7]
MAKCKKCENSFGIFELKNGICKSCIEKENPTCPGCKNSFKPGQFTEGYCADCYEERRETIEKKKELERQELELIEKKKQEKIALKKAEEKKKLDIQNIMLTTETHLNLKIEKRINIVSAECAFGMNIFKDLFTGVRDIVGGRSETLQKTLKESKETVLAELKKEAYEIGANAVIGIDLDYSEFTGGGKSMLFMVASGTAVLINEIE